MSASDADETSSHSSSPYGNISNSSVRRFSGPRQLISYVHFEEVLARINPFGSYQIFACICILYATIEWTGNSSFSSILGAAQPSWNCAFHNGTTANIKLSKDEDNDCNFIKNNCANLTAEKDSVEFYSLVAAWKLICDDKEKLKRIQLIQTVGNFFGALVGGHIGDHFGRMTGFFTSQLCIQITSVMTVAANSWYTFATCQLLNGFFYGLIEVMSLTLMMEYTNNRYRLIANACFQKPLAYITIALIAYLTKDWQYYFIFLNLVTSPIAIAFMLFLESPRWLVASGKLEEACEVLNDLAHPRWNNTGIKFTANDLNLISRDSPKQPPFFYNIYHLFCTPRLIKQSLMQLLSMFTYAVVSTTYVFVVRGMHENAILFTFFDGLIRLIVLLSIILLDFKFYYFGRKLQFILSLTIICCCYAAVIVLIALGMDYDHVAITVIVVVATMFNESAFWMNIVQITTQRFPTVIRCIAFGCTYALRHAGFIAGIMLIQPLLDNHAIWAFIIPEVLLLVTLFCGLFLQPETKGKALLDRLVEGHFGRIENEIPRALMRAAVLPRFNEAPVRERIRENRTKRVNNCEKEDDKAS